MLPDPSMILRAAFRRRRRKLLRWTATRRWLPGFIKRRADSALWTEYFEEMLDRYTIGGEKK